ncbi:MAG: stage II sporulation protein E [Clostridiales bacterium]|nr:stage II sporulation protein E [Clostridiales bacterium]
MDKLIANVGRHIKNTIYITKTDVGYFAMGIIGFFLGRVVLLSFLNPVAVPFLSVFMFMGARYYLVLLFSLIGLFTKLEFPFFLKYFLCAVIITGSNVTLKRFASKSFISPFVCGFSVLASGLIFTAFYGMSLYFALMAVLETVLAVSLGFVLKKSVMVMDGTVKRKILLNEEMISIGLLLGCVIAGAADVYIGNVSMRHVTPAIALMIIAHKNGAAYAAVSGVLLGFILLLTGHADVSAIGILSLSAFAAGLFSRFGKMGVMCAFLLCGAAVTFYLDRTLIERNLFLAAAVASLVFAFLPEGFDFRFDARSAETAENYVSKLKKITSQKLAGYEKSFAELSKTLSCIGKKKISLSKEDITALLDDICETVCSNCENKQQCWDKYFYRTYQAAASMLKECEEESKISQKIIPSDFKASCIKLTEFAEKTARIFEVYKTNLMWNNRMIESGELVCLQLSGVSDIMRTLRDDLNSDIIFKPNLEEAIKTELKKNKIEVERVIVAENKEGRYEVSIESKSCDKRKICLSDIVPVLSGVLGRKMKKEDEFCDVLDGRCELRIIEEQKFRITSAVARLACDKSGESGDSYSFMNLKNGHSLLVLSDGMGCGRKAKEESEAVVSLLEDFIESGFDKELAVKMINSALVLKVEESFSTLDICSLNLHSGVADFIKIGAASTFILRGSEVYLVKSSSLPMGMLNTVDLEVSVKKLKDNDIILMLTDGVLDVFADDELKEQNMMRFLRTVKYINPQDIADSVLEEAKRLSVSEVKDDMTVLAARVWEWV